MLKKNYTTPRKMRKGERPSTTLPKYLEKAHIEVMKNYDHLLATFKKMEPKARALRQKIKRMERDRLKKSFQWRPKAHRSALYSRHSKPIDSARGVPVLGPPPDIGAFTLAYYLDLQSYLNNQLPQAKEIKTTIQKVDWNELGPGSSIAIYGTFFGQNPSVFFQISSDQVIGLELQEYIEGFILARLTPSVGSMPLRPFNGWVWIETTYYGSKKQSNSYPVFYVPLQAEYLGYWTKELQGYGAGGSDDGTCFENVTLNDPDFWIECVTCNPSGDGDCGLHDPWAGGQDMAQGWHIGVSWFHHETMDIWYHLRGPAFIDPPQIDGLDGWHLVNIFSY